MYGLQRPVHRWLRYILLSGAGLYASPGWLPTLAAETIISLRRALQRPLTTGFSWNVRFDHAPLAEQLTAQGLPCERPTTHVLELGREYAQTLAGYSATTRNQVRRAQRQGVTVRAVQKAEEVRSYYRLHIQLAQQKGGYGLLHPLELFLEFRKAVGFTQLLIAEWEGRLIAGGLFFKDGDTLLYWHAAADRAYSHLFPAYAVLDTAIQHAHASGARLVNFGGSAGISSLERFKTSWGAVPRRNWCFTWRNPVWATLSRIRSKGVIHA